MVPLLKKYSGRSIGYGEAYVDAARMSREFGYSVIVRWTPEDARYTYLEVRVSSTSEWTSAPLVRVSEKGQYINTFFLGEEVKSSGLVSRRAATD